MVRSRTGAVDRVDADSALLAHSTLARIDHVDAHLLRTDGTVLRSAEQWAREILEHPPAAVRLRLRAGWTALGIALHHGRPDTVAGWPITGHTAEYLRLHGDSRIGLHGELITRVGDRGVTFAALVELDNPVARMIWAKVLPGHLTTVRSLMEGAAQRTA